jgi:hypothetical protein
MKDLNKVKSKSNRFIIKPFSGCEIYGVLNTKKQKATLEYFHEDSTTKAVVKINSDTWDSYNIGMLNSIVEQAKMLCTITNKLLWTY